MTNDNQIVPLDQWGKALDIWKDSPVDPGVWTSGIGSSWPIITIKGKEWGWRYRGIDHAYTAPNAAAGGSMMKVQFLDVVLVSSGNRISKVYYKGEFKPGERLPPTCWSADGITPDPGVNEKQSNTCRGCDHNAYRVGTEQGGPRGKACSDNKRLAVVTLDDLANTDFGGPFMLRLPPGSFQNYTTYCAVMANKGVQPYQCVTRMMFDSTPHPKVMFRPLRPLTREEGLIILEHQKNPRTAEMLNDKAIAAFADPLAEPHDGSSDAPMEVLPPRVMPPASNPPLAEKIPVAVDPLQEKINDLEARLAAAEASEPAPEPEPTPPAKVLTPEELKIKELEARLAEAEAKTKKGRPRTKPVSPPVEQTTAPVTPQGNGSAQEETTPSKLSNQFSDRIASLVKGAQ